MALGNPIIHGDNSENNLILLERFPAQEYSPLDMTLSTFLCVEAIMPLHHDELFKNHYLNRHVVGNITTYAADSLAPCQES